MPWITSGFLHDEAAITLAITTIRCIAIISDSYLGTTTTHSVATKTHCFLTSDGFTVLAASMSTFTSKTDTDIFVTTETIVRLESIITLPDEARMASITWSWRNDLKSEIVKQASCEQPLRTSAANKSRDRLQERIPLHNKFAIEARGLLVATTTRTLPETGQIEAKRPLREIFETKHPERTQIAAIA